jgi:3(or 17)beta-hydroxysteroid dehydrogenase
MTGRVEAKVCIVTGGAVGLGKASAAVLARERGQVVVTDVNVDEGQLTANEIAKDTGSDAVFLEHDVRDEDQWRRVVATTLERFGRLDVLVNNAGVIVVDDIETATLDTWRFVNSVNVEGTFLGCKHGIPAMRASGGRGSIVNMSSTVAVLGFPSAPAYTASKGAVQALTRSVAVYCMERGDLIRCNGVYPHNAESPMSLAHSAPGVARGSAFAVANAVLFLASDESSDLNGTFLNLDRGTACLVAERQPPVW